MGAQAPEIKLLTALEEAQVVSSITQAIDDAAEVERLLAAATAGRRPT
jgi:mannitol/fructose-specific phosphotransferase system IIA component